MKAHWWSYVLGLSLCMPAGVTLWTVSQRPMKISTVRVNSSVEISCSTSLPDPIGLYLRSYFHGGRDIVYLALGDGRVTMKTTAAEFRGRIHVTPEQQVRVGYEITLQLSVLAPRDTNLYYCTWNRFNSQKGTSESQSSSGSVIIVQETDPQKQCKGQMLVHVFIFLSGAAILILFLVTGALIFRKTRFKKRFRLAPAVRPQRPVRLQPVCPQHRSQYNPYLTTSTNTMDLIGIQ